MANYIVIPARLESKRLDRKLLLNETGKPLIQHTWENCLKVHDARTIIATDSEEIRDVCYAFGAEVHFDKTPASCGTERAVNVALCIDDCEAVVNIQGEWPTINPEGVQAIFHEVNSHYAPVMASLYYRCKPFGDHNFVKVVLGKHNRALYFSRANIPHGAEQLCYHVGAYALNRRMMQFYRSLIHEPWANQSESLEQLQVLHHHFPIYMKETNYTYGIDTQQTYDYFRDERLSVAAHREESECSA